MATLPFQPAKYNGVNLDVSEVAPSMDPVSFGKALAESLKQWKEEKKNAVWLRVPIQLAGYISAAHEHGFDFHHAEGSYAMLKKWLPDRPNLIPPFATHQVGVGGLVINSRQEVLCIQERNPLSKTDTIGYKLPGGMVNLGEELGDAAVREVYEETGVQTEFKSIVSFRHCTNFSAYGRSDMYVVCQLKPLTEDIHMDHVEIKDCRWIPLEEYARTARHHMNIYVSNMVLGAGLTMHGNHPADIIQTDCRSDVFKDRTFKLFHGRGMLTPKQ